MILCLDLASKTGWAFGALGETPTHGSFQLARPGAEPSAKFRALREWLLAFLHDHRDIERVVFEAPPAANTLGGRTNISTLRMLYGFPAIIEELLHNHPTVTVREADVGDVRRHFIGRRNYRSAEAKALTIAKCRQLGMNPVDDNAADAIALHHYVCALRLPAMAIKTSPLFQRGAA